LAGRNLILLSLDPKEREILSPHLEPVVLTWHLALHEPGEPIEFGILPRERGDFSGGGGKRWENGLKSGSSGGKASWELLSPEVSRKTPIEHWYRFLARAIG